MVFQFFDPKADVLISERNLPHWEQAGATYFITFRSRDSLPAPVLERWRMERDAWLRQFGIDGSQAGWKRQLLALRPADQRAFHETFSERWHALLDAGHGECVLQSREMSQIVADSLHFFDGQRYVLGDYVVMPNHVHLLVQFPGFDQLKRQCKSWKRFTATRIHARLGRHGHFWQDESFDHLVRSPEQYQFLREYIFENPRKAGLSSDMYAYYRCREA